MKIYYQNLKYNFSLKQFGGDGYDVVGAAAATGDDDGNDRGDGDYDGNGGGGGNDDGDDDDDGVGDDDLLRVSFWQSGAASVLAWHLP